MTSGQLTLVKTTFSRLNETATVLFHFFEEFGKLHNIQDNVHVYMLEDQIQKTEADTRRIFQI